MNTERTKITGEICRACGWSNAELGYEIDLRTNRVRYRVDCYIHGGGGASWERFFDDYQEAAQEFGYCVEQVNRANAAQRKGVAA